MSVDGGDINGASTKSYSGRASGTLILTADSSDEFNSVCFGGSGSIPELAFDASTSTLTIGQPATSRRTGWSDMVTFTPRDKASTRHEGSDTRAAAALEA